MTDIENSPQVVDWDQLLPVGKPAEVALSRLNFDTQNPRFTPDKRPDDDSDEAIVEKLASTADLSELTRSIATSGYINIEPLIVVLRDNQLVVLEGNRRLAALKALTNPALASHARLSIPPLKDSVKDTLDGILVYRVAKEEDARELIGFKHINGPQAWDAYAKAVFAARWLMSQDGKENRLTLLDIADRMGDNHSTIHRMVTAYFVLVQADKENLYSIDDRYKKSFSFSHLYTGLSYTEFTDYLKMRRPARHLDPDREPVPKEAHANLKQMLLWLYGSKTNSVIPIIQSQNPDLGRLREVLGSKAATTELEARADLGAAVVSATPKSVRFSRHVVNANAELMKAQETLDGFNPETQSELQEIVASMLKRAAVVKAGVDTAIQLGEQVEHAGEALPAGRSE